MLASWLFGTVFFDLKMIPSRLLNKSFESVVTLLLSLSLVKCQIVTGTYTILLLYTEDSCPTPQTPVSLTPIASQGNCTNLNGIYSLKIAQLGDGCDSEAASKEREVGPR